MDDRELLKGRIKDLAFKSQQNDCLTRTDFLSVSEQSLFFDIIKELGREGKVRLTQEDYLLYGGFADAERRIVCFLPSYLPAPTFIENEEDLSKLIACVRIEPLNARFSDELTHRDYLGTIMGLGLERDQIGDIICSDRYAVVFVLKKAATVLEQELTRVKHTTVSCREIPLGACDISPQFELKSLNIASERTDVIIAAVYHLSRTAAQELIKAGSLSVNGRVITDPGYFLKPADRVSVRGKGKFIYEGSGGTTRKGRLNADVKLFV